MGMRLPILLCLDVEPDDKVIEGHADWAGFRPLVELLTGYRPRLEAATGRPCRFTWFVRMDPMVRQLHGSEDWAATTFAREFEALRAAGDEIGLHVHTWKHTANGWVSEFRDPAWTEHCIRSSLDAYRRTFGRRCRSFRFGDRWMDQRTMRLLASLGIRYDLTLEPEQAGFPIPSYMEDIFLGDPPDYTGVPRQPYRPSSRDYRAPGRWPRRLRITEIPITTATREQPDVGTLYLANDSAVVCRWIDRLVADEKTTHLALPARTDIAIRADERKNLEATLDHILSHPHRQRMLFATPSSM